MNSNENSSQLPIRREPSDVRLQSDADIQAVIGYLPQSGGIESDERIPIAQAEGYDPLAIELAMAPAEASFSDKLWLIIFTAVAAALVIFFFPTERFFKPRTKDLGTMSIGGPTAEADLHQTKYRSEPWFGVLLEIDRLYFGEGKLSEAIRVAESALEIVPKKNWERWEKIHYRYWELLSAAGRVHALKTATQAYLQILPEDPFANYYYSQAFLTATDRIRSFTAETKETCRQEAEAIIRKIENACNSLNAQRKHPKAQKKEDAFNALYQKLRLQQAKLFVLIWRLGGYQEDKHPDVVYRDNALNICESAELVDSKEAKRLKIDIYNHIIDRWYWFEGQQVVQGTSMRRKTLEQAVRTLKKELNH